jgi:Fis family transcriptional regulator
VATTKSRLTVQSGGNSHADVALCSIAEQALKDYFRTLNGHRPGDLYEMVIGEVERPLLKTVLDYTEGNQSQAADILGINRGTLRKKLRQHGLLR